MAKKESTEAKEFAIAAAKIALGRHCSKITVVDLRGKSPATDYFVIATSTSARQGRTVCEEICVFAKKNGWQPFGRAGHEHGKWILVDFVDVVVHIFDEEYREYYDLEMLWGDAERLAIE